MCLNLSGSVGCFCHGILRLSSIIFNSPFEYDVIKTFIRAHKELVLCSRTPSPRLWDFNCGNSCNTFVYFIVPIATEKVSRIRSNIVSYLESVEEYSEGKIHMSEPESGKGNVSTVYFVNQARGNT